MNGNSLYGPLDPATDAGYADPPPRMGFFTDTSVCIGCKACEVACKEWNGGARGRAEPARHVLRQHRRAERQHVAARRVHRAAAASASPNGRRPRAAVPRNARRRPARPAARPGRGQRVPLAHVIGRVQALHTRRLPGCVPHRCAVPHRVRHRGRPGGHLQRLRLLRSGLSIRGDRPA
jgi:ferredoxin